MPIDRYRYIVGMAADGVSRPRRARKIKIANKPLCFPKKIAESIV